MSLPAWVAPSPLGAGAGQISGRSARLEARSLAPAPPRAFPPKGQFQGPTPRKTRRRARRGGGGAGQASRPPPPAGTRDTALRPGDGGPGLEAPAPYTPVQSRQWGTSRDPRERRVLPQRSQRTPLPLEGASEFSAAAPEREPLLTVPRRPPTGRPVRLPERQLPRGAAWLARALFHSFKDDCDFLTNSVGSQGSEQASQRHLRCPRWGAGD